MKNLILIFAVIFVFGSSGSRLFGQTKPDIYIRPALYFGGVLNAGKEMNKGSQYATPDKPLEISKSESIYQKDGFYFFSGGYYLYLKTPQNTLSSFEFTNQIDYGLDGAGYFLHKPKPDDKNIVGYVNGVWAIANHQNIGLKEGVNFVTLKLDVGGKISESDEKNNVYQFKVTLKP